MTKMALQVLGWAAKPEGWGRVPACANEQGDIRGPNAFLMLQRRQVKGGLLVWCEIGQCFRITAAGRLELARLQFVWSVNGGMGPVGAELERLYGDRARAPSARRARLAA